MPLYLNTLGNSSIAISICDRCSRKFPIVELFHDPSKGSYALGEIARNNTLSFSRDDKSGRFSLRMSQQAADGSVNSISAFLSEDEALLLELMLERAVARFYDW